MRVLGSRSLAGLALSLAAPLAGAAAQEASTERPNIVLIISDDQDYEHLGFLGDGPARTPALDRLAEGGTVFPVAHVSMSRCRPSLATLLSGRWPHEHGIFFNRSERVERFLDPTDSLPNLLSSAGYVTYMGGKYWETDPEAMGFGQGAYDRNFARNSQEDLFAFIDRHAGKEPIFVWWAPFLPHHPHKPPERYLRKIDPATIPVPEWIEGDAELYQRRQQKFLAMVAWFDDGVRRLHERIEEAGILRNTLFVFLIDNGYSIGHLAKGSPFEKGLRTPLVFDWQGRIPSGKSLPRLVSSIDVYPTILDYAGIEIPATASGRSLRPWIDGVEPAETETPSDRLFGALYPVEPQDEDLRPEHNVYALYARTPRWKYVLYLRRITEDTGDPYKIFAELAAPLVRERGDEDLYDLSTDPYEHHDLAGLPEHASRIEGLRAEVLEWWRTTGGRPLELP